MFTCPSVELSSLQLSDFALSRVQEYKSLDKHLHKIED